MDYILRGHKFEDEVLSLAQLFFPNNVYCLKNSLSESTSEIAILNCLSKDKCVSYLYKNKSEIARFAVKVIDNDVKSIKKYIKTSLYYCFKKINDIKIPWGILTGIRPSKRIYAMWEDGFSDFEIGKILEEDYLVSKDKI